MTRSVRMRPTSELESEERRFCSNFESEGTAEDFWIRYLVSSLITGLSYPTELVLRRSGTGAIRCVLGARAS